MATCGTCGSDAAPDGAFICATCLDRRQRMQAAAGGEPARDKEAETRELEGAHLIMESVRFALDSAGPIFRPFETMSPVVPIELYGPDQRPVQSVLADDDKGRKWLLVLIPTAIKE